MEVVSGSHRLGQLHHGQTDSAHNLLSRGQTVTEDVDLRDTVFMAIRAGQMSLHHTHLVHRSGANRTDHRRIGLGISYIPTSARCRCRTRLGAMLVRGVDRYGNFDDEPRPQTDYGAAERAFHAQAVARFREANREETLRYETAA
jgi:ectoine hydroxylase-related dioxygenase (phytanoyl-CoA dioxygenase family)